MLLGKTELRGLAWGPCLRPCLGYLGQPVELLSLPLVLIQLDTHMHTCTYVHTCTYMKAALKDFKNQQEQTFLDTCLLRAHMLTCPCKWFL